RALDQLGRRRTERVDDQPYRVLHRDLDHRHALRRRERQLLEQPADYRVAFAAGQRRDAGRVEQAAYEVEMLGGEQALGIELELTGLAVGRRHQHVDAVGTAVDVGVDPAQLLA